LPMDFIPGVGVVHRRTEMVAERHWWFSSCRGEGKRSRRRGISAYN
jgi:hypothetical protein